MAKYSRFDPRNKKKNRNKSESVVKQKSTNRRSSVDSFDEHVKEYRVKHY